MQLRTALLFLLAFVSSLNCASFCAASNTEESSERVRRLRALLDSVDQAKDDFKPFDKTLVDATRSRLKLSRSILESRINFSSPETAEGWKKYLRWDELTEILESKQSSARKTAVLLIDVIKRLKMNYAGLEQVEFVQFRKDLTDLKNATIYANRKNFENDFKVRIKALKKYLELEIKSPTISNANSIGRVVGVFDDAGLVPDLVKEIRREYGRPNIVFSVSEDLVNELAYQQPVRNSQPVNEIILGTQQSGNATTKGFMQVDFKPSWNQANLILNLEGITQTSTVGTRGVPVFGQISFHSRGHTRVHTESRLFFGDTGLQASPTAAQCQTNSTLVGICSPNLIKDIVRREIHKNTPEANYIASRRAEIKLQNEVDSQVNEIVYKTNQQYRDKVIAPLVRTDTVPRSYRVASTEKSLLFEACQAGVYQLGAFSKPQNNLNEPVTVHIHESLIANYLETMLASEKIDYQQIEKLNLPKDPNNKDLGEWEIALYPIQPVRVEFRDGITFFIKLAQMKVDRTTVKRPMTISAKYKVDANQGFNLVRDGKINLEFDGKAIKTLAQSTLKANFEESLEESLPQKIDLSNIKLPANVQLQGKPSIKTLSAKDGWLSLGMVLLQ